MDFYSEGAQPNPHLDSRIRRLDLTADEKAALLAFLRALSGEVTEGVLEDASGRSPSAAPADTVRLK